MSLQPFFYFFIYKVARVGNIDPTDAGSNSSTNEKKIISISNKGIRHDTKNRQMDESGMPNC